MRVEGKKRKGTTLMLSCSGSQVPLKTIFTWGGPNNLCRLRSSFYIYILQSKTLSLKKRNLLILPHRNMEHNLNDSAKRKINSWRWFCDPYFHILPLELWNTNLISSAVFRKILHDCVKEAFLVFRLVLQMLLWKHKLSSGNAYVCLMNNTETIKSKG